MKTIRKRFVSIFIFIFLFFPLVSQSKTDYVKIPFELKNGYILLPVNFSKSAQFQLVLDTTGDYSMLTQKGIENLSDKIGEDIYAWLRRQIKNKEPQLSEQALELRLQSVSSGEISLINMRNLWIGSVQFTNEVFFDEHNSHLPGDGCIGIKIFNKNYVKNMVIDYKNKTFELNAQLHKGNGVPMHRINSDSVYGYYILAELDGEEQPFILATGTSIIVVQENKTESGKKKESTRYEAEIRVGENVQKYAVMKNNDSSIRADDFTRSVFPNYNILGLPFFKDKCVQFDFENMMLYVW